LARFGFKNFYIGWSDYLPGYPYILWLLGKINLWGIFPQILLYKLPAIVADLATGYLIYKILEKSKGIKWGLIGGALYLFNPAILANSALWGQVDALTALCALFSVYQFPLSLFWSALGLAVGTLIKPQTAFIFPVILFLFLKQKRKLTDLLIYCLFGLLIFVLGFLPFWNHGAFIPFVFERLGVSASQYPYTSVNAFNFWGIFGFWNRDSLFSQAFGYLIFTVIFAVTSWKLWKRKNPEYILMSIAFLASFIFFTRIHERHLLPLFASLAIVAIESPTFLIPYIGFSLTYIANLYYAYIWISENFKRIFSDFTLKLFCFINVGLAAFMLSAVIRDLKIGWKGFLGFLKRTVKTDDKKVSQFKLPAMQLSPGKIKYILGIILAFAFLTRIFDLISPVNEYFDEVYHAFTAKVILHGGRAAWEWWNTPPAGFAYEWTHPPLAKLGMVAGMLVFGENSFGWRIPGALLGVGSVFLVYLLAKYLFKDETIGLLSAAVFSLDGLFLVLSRIGMNDSYLLFFTLLAIYLFLKQKDFPASIAYGLALASKWSALWAAPILFVLWLKREKKFKPSIFWFILLPFAVYLLAYLPMFLTGHDFSVWWGMQKQMWWYHTGLKATHPYTSPWWSWPLLLRPIYLYTSEEVGNMVARIYAFGNPFVFWFGLTSVIISAGFAYLERNKNLALVVFAYLIFFVPWAMSPRIMFLYHYLPSIPFLAIATAYILRRNPKLTFAYLFICLFVFIYFYPHWAGLQVPLWLDRSYYWIASWR
jgi:dolichyl-phosphate-mannose-protein mannosyltransferase